MPEVDLDRDLEECFAHARALTAAAVDGPEQGADECSLAVITPGRLIIPIPGPPADAVTQEMLAELRGIVPCQPKQRITVIAFTDIVLQGALTVRQIDPLIPFLGYLMGMATDGHSVVVFEGHPAALHIGCRAADLLIVDQAMVGHLQRDWAASARAVMRQPQVLIFSRDDSVLPLDPAGAPVLPGRQLAGEWFLFRERKRQ
jgi:hypothetical protein